MAILEIFRTKIELIQTIQTAIISTLKTYSSSSIKAKTAFIKNQKASADISVLGVIWLTNEKNEKTALALGFSDHIFKKIYQNTFKEKIDGVNEENKDLAGELVNIIFQTVDPDLRIHNYKFNASLPDILTGKRLEDWLNMSTEVTLVIPFTIESDVFYFELSEIKEEKC